MHFLELFPNLTPHLELPYWRHDHYLFYFSSEKKWFTVPKQQIEKRDYQILKMLLQEISTVEEWTTENEKRTHSLNNHYNFEGYILYLQFFKPLNEENNDDLSFILTQFFKRFTIHQQFQQEMIIFVDSTEQSSIQSLHNLIQSDLYMNVRIGVGVPLQLNDYSALLAHLETEYEVVKYLLNKDYTQSILFLKRATFEILTFFDSHVLIQLFLNNFESIYLQQKEIFESVISYIHHQHNLTQTAKNLFVHRNTLLNRLQRFEKQTTLSLSNSQEVILILYFYFYLDNMHNF